MAQLQQRFVRLEKLLLVEPFKIIGLWSNGETRINDFSSEVAGWKTADAKEIKRLANPKIFKTAFVIDPCISL